MKKIFKLSSQHLYWLNFLLAMTEKEIKARYKHAMLGFLWIIINPLLQMMVIGFVFQFFVPVRVDNYFLFLFTGLLPWNFISMSVSKTTPSFVHERSLIQKSNFPREIIPLSIILSNMFHLSVSLGLFLLVLIGDKIFLDGYSFLELANYIFGFLGLLPLLLWMTILVSGLALLFSTLNVKYRDVNFIVQALTPIWFYATPVVYTLNLLPEFLQPFFYLNPVTAIIESFHQVLLNLPISHPQLFAISIATTLAIIVIGWKVFLKESKNFDDWV